MRAGARHLAASLALALALPVLAEAPDRSPRPDPRPGSGTVPAAAAPQPNATTQDGVTRVIVQATDLAPRASLRPDARPGQATAPVTPAAPPPTVTTAAAAPIVAAPGVTERPRRPGLFGGLFRPREPRNTRPADGSLAVLRSLRPELRPAGLEARSRAAATRQISSRVAQPGQRGTLCGIPGLVGERLETIRGRQSGCGIAEPIRLREVDGIALSTPATINCTTAAALQTWLQTSAVPTVGRRGGGISSLRVVASYACRTRNSQSGARLSEHALGNAIDIAGIGLSNGTELTVLGGWRDRQAGPLLQSMHRGACGPFGTVLGPNSDRFHQDHFHFDVASYRSGPYCR